ncbi:MAG: hypothetical protein JSS30_04835 [Verrucomicrobia bacterium]|nr:hypothetical protein [Verrucomicrobiota bacterium]
MSVRPTPAVLQDRTNLQTAESKKKADLFSPMKGREFVPVCKTPTRIRSHPAVLRVKTKLQTAESKKKAELLSPMKGRVVLPLDKTATRIRAEGHDCKMVDTAITTQKVFARMVHSLSHFALAFAFGCKTIRGKTHQNGAHSNCGGCQAAHAALNCKIKDDILQRAERFLSEKRFSELEPNYQNYLKSRFKFKDEELTSLDSPESEIRMKILKEKTFDLKADAKKLSFIGTSVEFERAATYENPTSSNRFDIYIENRLRAKEAEYAEKCSTGELTLVEALEKLQADYRSLVISAIDNLNIRHNNLDNLRCAFNDMIAKQQGEDFESYLQAVDAYLKAFETFFTNPPDGTPKKIKHFKPFLNGTQSNYNLTQLQKNRSKEFFEEIEYSLKIPVNADQEFDKVETEIERRLVEACYQLDGLNHTAADFQKMINYAYGKPNEKGELQPPDKERIGNVFCVAFLSRKN